METRSGLALMAILFSIFVFQCRSSESSDVSAASTEISVSAAQTDSLRRLYQAKLAETAGRMPASRIIEKNKVYPVDEAPLDTSFFLFREYLLDVIARRDVLSLLDACDKNVKSSFGGDDTVAQFVETWQLDKDANDSELWTVLEKVLRNGGTFDQGRRSFAAPYTFSLFPDEFDAFSHGVITGEGVRLRESPSTNARIITNLNFDVVENISTGEKITETIGGEEYPWVKVKTIDGREGWIYGKYFASPIDFRAGFERQPNGEWQMVYLVAGD